MCDCPPCPFSPLSSVFAELQKADLITREEYKGMKNISDMFKVQTGKSPEVQHKTADILRRHGLDKTSNRFASKQTQPLIHVSVLYSGALL